MEFVDYVSTFICVAPDSAAVAGVAPTPNGEKPTVASAMFDMLMSAPPYTYRSSDVIFTVWADRNDVPAETRPEVWPTFFQGPHACLRSSELGKRFGWGIHANADGRLAVYAVGTPEYAALAAGFSRDGSPVKVTRALRTGR